MGLNVPFCSIFVPFHFYLVIDIGCAMFRYHIHFWFCWSLNLQKLVQWNLLFWILVALGVRGGCACMGMVCHHCIIHILNSSKKLYFLCTDSDLCRAMLPNYLRTYSSALCQIRALQKAFKKQNNGQSVPKILVLNSCIWLARTNTQNSHTILYIFCL